MPYCMTDINIVPLIKLIQSPKNAKEVGDLASRATWSLTVQVTQTPLLIYYFLLVTFKVVLFRNFQT